MACCALFTVTETIWFQVHWKTTHLFEMPHPETAKVPSTIQNSLSLVHVLNFVKIHLVVFT